MIISKAAHDLKEMIVIAVSSIIGSYEGFDKVEVFVNAQIDWFKKFLVLENGIPSLDTFEMVFVRLNPIEFRDGYSSWVNALVGLFCDVVAIVGQTHRGAKRADKTKSPLHIVSA